MTDKIAAFFSFILFGWVCHFFGHRKIISDWRVHLSQDDFIGHSAYRVTPDGNLIVYNHKGRYPKQITPAEILLMIEERSCGLCGHRVARLEYANLDDFRKSLIHSLLEWRCQNPWYLDRGCKTKILGPVSGDSTWLDKQK